MVEYKCEKCLKVFSKKYNMERHFEKKHIDSDIENEEEFQNIPNIPKIDKKNICMLKNLESELLTKHEEYIKVNNKPKELIIEIPNQCKYCNIILSTTGNLNKHIKNNCKVKKEQKQEKEMIFKQLLIKEEENKHLQEQILLLLEQQKRKDDELYKKNEEILKKNEEIFGLIKETKSLNKINKSKKIVNTNSNNINTISNSNNKTINNTVNIQIAQFGKENFNEIDKKHFEKIIRNPRILGVKVPEEILKMLHFNPDYPQFQNFYVSDFNRDRIMVHDGNTWILETPDKIKSVLEQIITFSKEKLEEYKDKKLSEEVLNRLKRIEDAINKCDDDFIADLKEMAEETECNIKTLELIKNYEQFQKEVLDKLKKISYNEGKKIIKFYN
jgi:hypothetical protein